MARLPSTIEFNENRIRALNIKRTTDEQILLTVDEAREVISSLIRDEMFLFSDDLTRARKIELEERINFKLKQIERSFIDHVDEKFNKVTEALIAKITSSAIEQEVEKRVEKKLKTLKNLL